MVQKVRIFKLADEFAVENDVMVAKVQNLGFAVRNYMSAIVSNRVLQEPILFIGGLSLNELQIRAFL